MLAWVALAVVAAGGAVAVLAATAPKATAGDPGQSLPGGVASAPPPTAYPPTRLLASVVDARTWPGGSVAVRVPTAPPGLLWPVVVVGGWVTSLATPLAGDPSGWRVRVPNNLPHGTHLLELKFGSGKMVITPSGSAQDDRGVVILSAPLSVGAAPTPPAPVPLAPASQPAYPVSVPTLGGALAAISLVRPASVTPVASPATAPATPTSTKADLSYLYAK
jgi:hypothetical protein